eukprot:5777821-Pleurochrysis_carterae.AAC.1
MALRGAAAHSLSRRAAILSASQTTWARLAESTFLAIYVLVLTTSLLMSALMSGEDAQEADRLPHQQLRWRVDQGFLPVFLVAMLLRLFRLGAHYLFDAIRLTETLVLALLLVTSMLPEQSASNASWLHVVRTLWLGLVCQKLFEVHEVAAIVQKVHV